MRQNLDLDPISRIALLSPHLDDAVLSCGSLIADATVRGIDVLVITLFNGRPEPPVSPAAARFHARCGHTDENAMAEREREDDQALSLLGARTIRLGLPEALYRKDDRGRHVYNGDTDIFVQQLPQARDFLDVVADGTRSVVETAEPDLVLAPLGVGGHIDHLLVREAARALDHPTWHYEDVPYLLYDRCEGWQDALSLRDAVHHDATPDGWSAKLTAIDCYASQRELLWYNPPRWREELTDYAATVGGGSATERLWTLR